MDEQKRAAAETKRKATYARKREREAARRNDRIRAIEVAREIRDNPNSSSTDQLRAVMLLRELKA